jgi:hypothetical protein
LLLQPEERIQLRFAAPFPMIIFRQAIQPRFGRL